MKKKYRVFFEIYGKKMQAVIEAFSKEDAANEIKDRILFHKIVLDVQPEERGDKGLNDLISFLGL
jgi:hypothetical protein